MIRISKAGKEFVLHNQGGVVLPVLGGADLSVDAAYPRDELFRTSGEYAHLCRVASTKPCGLLRAVGKLGDPRFIERLTAHEPGERKEDGVRA